MYVIMFVKERMWWHGARNTICLYACCCYSVYAPLCLTLAIANMHYITMHCIALHIHSPSVVG